MLSAASAPLLPAALPVASSRLSAACTARSSPADLCPFVSVSCPGLWPVAFCVLRPFPPAKTCNGKRMRYEQMGGGGFQKYDATAAHGGDMRGGRSVRLRSPGNFFFCISRAQCFPRSSLLYFCFCATTTIKIVGPAPPSFPVTHDGQGAGRYRKTERPIAAGDTPTGMLIGVSCARTHSRRWCPWPRLSSSLRARRSPPCSWRPGRRPPARPRCRTS